MSDGSFRMPRFLRVAWASERLRGEWQPRLRCAREALRRTRIQALSNRRLDGRIVDVSNTVIRRLTVELSAEGCAVVPLHRTDSNGTYLLARLDAIKRLDDALRLGDLFGFSVACGLPECCAHAHASRRLSTWSSVSATRDDSSQVDVAETLNVKLTITENIFLERLGLMLSPFLPCRSSCKHAQLHAAQALEYLSKEARDIISEVLAWSLRWSSLHGITELRLPVLRAIHDDVSYMEERVVLRHGESPSGMPRGVVFPFSGAEKRRLPVTV